MKRSYRKVRGLLEGSVSSWHLAWKQGREGPCPLSLCPTIWILSPHTYSITPHVRVPAHYSATALASFEDKISPFHKNTAQRLTEL